jgi:UDP-N-acetylmuramyl pentapeptide synthase
VFTIDDVRNALSDCLKGEWPGAASEFTGVTNDSRVAKPGKLLVALTTPTGYAIEVRDGHDFIGDAMAHGATGVVLQRGDIPNSRAVPEVPAPSATASTIRARST